MHLFRVLKRNCFLSKMNRKRNNNQREREIERGKESFNEVSWEGTNLKRLRQWASRTNPPFKIPERERPEWWCCTAIGWWSLSRGRRQWQQKIRTRTTASLRGTRTTRWRKTTASQRSGKNDSIAERQGPRGRMKEKWVPSSCCWQRGMSRTKGKLEPK